MPFRNVSHPYLGTWRVYMPQGFSPIQPAEPQQVVRAVLCPGDLVFVESAWHRDYLPDTEPDLLYVRNASRDGTTHVTAADLRLEYESVK